LIFKFFALRIVKLDLADAPTQNPKSKIQNQFIPVFVYVSGFHKSHAQFLCGV
jgi:hypothetical protein